MARNLIDADSGALALKRYLIVDRDTTYTERFKTLVKEDGTEIIRLPPMSSGRRRCVERSANSLRTKERNHQGLSNRLIRPQRQGEANHDAIDRRQRLGGIRAARHPAKLGSRRASSGRMYTGTRSKKS